VRVGVIGVGALGWHHVRHLSAMPGAALVGVYDIRQTRASEVAAAFGTTAFPSRESLLDLVDAAVIAVPTAAHCEVCLAALDAGAAAFLEKPMASTLGEADLLVDAATRPGAVLQVGHIERFNPIIRAAKPLVSRPLFVEGERLAPFQPRGTDVPVVLDLMIHDLDLILHLAGEPPQVEIRANGAAVLSPLLDVAHARVEFADGLVASVTASRIARERLRRLRIFQEEGFLSLDLGTGRGELLRLRGGWQPDDAVALADVAERIPLEPLPEDALRLELDSFLAAVRGEAPSAVTAREGRAALELALRVSDAVQLSIALATPDE
jgi:predicted dehydrogenase